MSNFSLPLYVVSVLTTLESHGYRAYLVGGSVRDYLMGRIPNDFDICTSALPQETMLVFPHSHPTGIKHGTITVVMDGHPLEVTTFRSDGVYSDHRRPERVEFITDLKTDLMRRDFTMNAMAMSKSGEIIDLFGGVTDIKSRTIRCVGNPKIRFEEDALRMLRAMRFSAQLNFKIEDETYNALIEKAFLCKELANERIYVEIKKALLSDNPQIISEIINNGLMCGILGDNRTSPNLSILKKIHNSLNPRYAALCFLLIQNGTIDNVVDFSKSLRVPNSTIECADISCEILKTGVPSSELEWKRLLSKNRTDCIICTSVVCDTLYGGKSEETVKKILQRGDCISLQQLAIGGKDLQSIGLSGIQIGKVLNELLEIVLQNPNKNEYDTLMKLANEFK